MPLWGSSNRARRAQQRVPSIEGAGTFARRSLLSHYGIRSGAAIPVVVGQRVAAVIEVLSFDQLQPDRAMETAVDAVRLELEHTAATSEDALVR
jgi:hypothetical protein